MRVKYLAQEHNNRPWPVIQPGPPDPGSRALTIRPLCLLHRVEFSYLKYNLTVQPNKDERVQEARIIRQSLCAIGGAMA